MTDASTFEVETRFSFGSRDELFRRLPFLVPCLRYNEAWITVFYGLDLFLTDQLLRIARISTGVKERRFLGWKGIDIGKFANIRQELQEDITDGVHNSSILHLIGAKVSLDSTEAVVHELEHRGYKPFMEFSGKNVVGIYEPLDLKVKLMYCSALEHPLLLEIEKTATTNEDAIAAEIELQLFTATYNLQQNVVRQEPPDLLYARIFNSR